MTKGTTARGYGNTHQQLRKQWAPQVAAGGVHCWRCGQPIDPTPLVSKRTGKPMASWHIGHDDNDRTVTRGPEHSVTCNLAAAGRRGGTIATTNRAMTVSEW